MLLLLLVLLDKDKSGESEMSVYLCAIDKDTDKDTDKDLKGWLLLVIISLLVWWMVMCNAIVR